jgi:DNA replication protein DnaC
MPETRKIQPNPDPDALRERLRRLGLFGLLAHGEQMLGEAWLPRLVEIEEADRQRRSLERRLHNARLGVFKPMADFEWNWPKKLDRELIDDLFTFGFVREAANVVLLGPNGVGKSMIAKNLAHQAILAGHTARFTTASEMLHDLAAQDSDLSLTRRLRRYCTPTVLAIDEVGYLSYDTRYADLLFEVVTRRYQQRPIILTTNKPFGEWSGVFPNAACVVTLVDRLLHRAEIVNIEGSSYRLKEAKERAAAKAKARASRPKSRQAG